MLRNDCALLSTNVFNIAIAFMKYFSLVCALLMTSFLFSQEPIIEEITFEGLKRVDESLLRRLIKVKSQTAYDSIKVATDIERLNRLPAIANATVVQTKLTDSTYKLTYKIVENFTIIPGLRISEANDGSFAFRVSAFEFNFLGQSQILGGFYQRDVFDSYGAYWEAPFLITNKLGLGVNYIKNVTFEPIYLDETPINYKKDDVGAEIYGLYEIDFHNKAELGVRVLKESYDIDDTEVQSVLPAGLDANKVSLRGEYETNFLNITYQYVEGVRNLLDVRYVLGGDGLLEEGLVAQNATEYFKKIGTKGNWASRLQLGYASYNESEFAPFTVDNQFNLRGAGNDIDRGTSFVFVNTEYRHTLIEKDWFVLQGNAFVDAGSIRSPREGFDNLASINNVELYSGLGVRFIHKRIFNAVIRLDYGVGLGATQNRGLVFGIGQYF